MTRRRRTAARLLARHRRLLGAACAALALTGAVLLVRPPPEPAARVVVAARALDARAPLSTGDLTTRTVPARLVPDHAVPAGADLAGRSLAGPLARGEILTRARLADPPARHHGDGLVAAPVRLADPGAAALVRPGSRVDVLAAADPSADPSAAFGAGPAPPAATVAADRAVIAVPEPAADSHGALLLLAVTPAEARALAGHTPAGHLSITIRG
ncbi:SAF domain-containing protein [Nocardiopsis trehalosi]|uniref:SAF domain-containing protein n=1 Tax=Nocardiopsis trehalosi TaxID=109329 RepID=UPI000834A26D|nr:SAF domain-containing protein [Nocardiopsis trehalosi]